MSNIIILSLIGFGLVTSFSFIYSVKKEFKFVEHSEIKGSERLTSKVLDVGAFQEVESYDQIRVFLTQGESNVEISAEDNLLEFLKVENKDGVLRIFREHRDSTNISSNLPMVVNISNPYFSSIIAHQQSEIQIEGSLEQNAINIITENQSVVRGAIEVDTLQLSLAQQSNMYLNGNCNLLNLELGDQSEIKAGSLVCQSVNVQVNDQADAKLNAVKSISGNVRNFASLTVEKLPEDNSILKGNRASLHTGWD